MTEKYRITASRISEAHGGRELLSISEVEELLDLDRRTIIGHRLLPVRRQGNRLRFSVADVAEYLTRSTSLRYR